MVILLLLVGCIRPTDSYDVRLHGEGTSLGDVGAPLEPMGGAIEVARFRLWGTNLGHGVVGWLGDLPRADGTSFTVGTAAFGYPADPAFDRTSAFWSPGPVEHDACVTRIGVVQRPAVAENVDVGDAIAITGEGTRIVLPRDPAVHPRPAGESWFVGYGGALGPVVQDHPILPATWASGELTVSFPGTLPPPEATFGGIPYPASGPMVFPAEVEGLQIAGRPVRPPEDEADGRHPLGAITWEPGDGTPLTVTVRYLSDGAEIPCSECDLDCGEGFTCDTAEGWCVPLEGSTWAPVGEVTCTVADDGEFELTAAHLAGLEAVYPAADPEISGVTGAILLVGRISDGTLAVPDVLTWNDRRVPVGKVRLRAVDAVVTRLELP